MAITNERSLQMGALLATPKREVTVKEMGARVRLMRCDFTQGAAAGDIGSTMELGRLPAGARLLGTISFLRISAFGAARLLDIGLRAHRNAQTGAVVAENAEAINSDVDVSAAVLITLSTDANGAMLTGADQIVVTGDVDVFATVAGGTIPAGATIKGELFYVVD